MYNPLVKQSFCFIALMIINPNTWMYRRLGNHRNLVNLLAVNDRPPKMFFLMDLCEDSLFALLHQCTAELSEKIKGTFVVCVHCCGNNTFLCVWMSGAVVMVFRFRGMHYVPT